jgi:hypothetical protein
MLASVAAFLALLAGCGSSTSTSEASAAALADHLRRGVAEIRGTYDKRTLYAELGRTIARIRRDRASTGAARRARRLAILGFQSMRKATRSQLDFSENDSGNVEAATRDARRADTYSRRGATLLRAAGRALGIRVGKLNGY